MIRAFCFALIIRVAARCTTPRYPLSQNESRACHKARNAPQKARDNVTAAYVTGSTDRTLLTGLYAVPPSRARHRPRAYPQRARRQRKPVRAL